MTNYEEIMKANSEIRTVSVKGKAYAEVNERIMAFRKVFPDGFVKTKILRLEDGICVMKAQVGINVIDDDGFGCQLTLGTGHACEKEGSSYINETSFIENCETSAVGRALGMAGFGVSTSIASYEEVSNAIANQSKRKASPKQIAVLRKAYQGENMDKLLEANQVTRLEDIPMDKASELIGKLKGEN